MTANSLAYKSLLESIRVAYGYDFTQYAEASVIRRIDRFMQSRRIDSTASLETLLLGNERFFEEFIQDLSITVTEMFRDPLFYKAVREKVLKRLATYPFIKVWIAGCATGEEVYSTAIVLREADLLERSIIYATDINQKSLDIARNGVYPAQNMKLYTTNYQQSGGVQPFSIYYKAKYNSVMFDRSLRENIVFAPHNLAADKSFNEFQLIICRNVMIYFNHELQKTVIRLFAESLCAFGFLCLGIKESLHFSDEMKCFDEVDRRQKIYIKNR